MECTIPTRNIYERDRKRVQDKLQNVTLIFIYIVKKGKQEEYMFVEEEDRVGYLN